MDISKKTEFSTNEKLIDHVLNFYYQLIVNLSMQQ